MLYSCWQVGTTQFGYSAISTLLVPIAHPSKTAAVFSGMSLSWVRSGPKSSSRRLYYIVSHILTSLGQS
jgi:hypothetical protein